MPAMLVQPGFDQQSFEAFLHARNEPAWLVEQRREAWQSFCEKDWPQRNDEEWIRTDIRLFKLSQFALPNESTLARSVSESIEALLTEGVNLAGDTSAINSRPAASRLKPKWAEKGVIFGSLDELIHSHSDIVQKHLFTRAVDPNYDKFSALHAACWSGGHLLYVPRNVVIDEPLHCLSAMSNGGIDLGHTLIVLEEGAEAAIMCETASDAANSGGFHCGATEVIL